jgi:hypothetical protein
MKLEVNFSAINRDIALARTDYRFVHEGKLLAPPRTLAAYYVQAVNKIYLISIS